MAEGLRVRKNFGKIPQILAIPNLIKKDIVLIKKILNRMKQCKEGNDIDSYSELNTEFHTFFYQRSRNEWLCQINHGLMNHITLLRKLSMKAPGKLKRSYKEHEDIVKAIESGSANEVAERMRLHMIAAWKLISRTLPETFDNVLAFKKQKDSDLIQRDDFHERNHFNSIDLNDTYRQCTLEKIVDKPFGIVVRTNIQQKRVIPLMRFPLEVGCVRRFDVNELLFIDVDQKFAAAELRAAGLGFIEFQYGTVLKNGDHVIVGDTIIGEVAGIVEQHSPNYLGIVIRSQLNIKEINSKIIFGQKVEFTSKKDKNLTKK